MDVTPPEGWQKKTIGVILLWRYTPRRGFKEEAISGMMVEYIQIYV